ncbi:ATP-binding cassette domain-containing protein [Enterococcus sp. CWB-B31]|uniref:ATP-binding cassette domain-containing protein n=1 Tax=Enterococcus sp. CWB-B31 TaxID=2885159 RepID=UPI001E390272|nr:ATP-binding cassette domain-containing protein [Enterococcus sp. CWB-B31]MCB5955059.1 ATP-binding cassette domain-containing protein [Enterococcus sp. CWB-B31]
MDSILTINKLKIEKSNKVILDIDQEIAILPKDKVAVLGENGAGKTTLINAILGEINFEGKIVKNFDKLSCGIVFQENSYNDLLKVNELIKLVLPFKKEELSHFLENYELEDLKKKYIKDLSGGERQRLTLSLVLESNKSIYFFDELTSGLDYKKRLSLLAMMKRKVINRTVINVTHYFDEIENWATKILMLKQGQLIFFGSVVDFFSKFAHYSIVKIDYNEFSKLNETTIKSVDHTDTGDGEAFICSSPDLQIDIEKTFEENSISYTVIKQSIYTTYLVAYSMTETTSKLITEVRK